MIKKKYILLITLISFLFTQTNERIYRAYPTIFVHGLNDNSLTWGSNIASRFSQLNKKYYYFKKINGEISHTIFEKDDGLSTKPDVHDKIYNTNQHYYVAFITFPDNNAHPIEEANTKSSAGYIQSKKIFKNIKLNQDIPDSLFINF